ncbi:WRKY domain [Sesbania bispinosa]|nr:WRKY domain [Sesbania bispinosa]
MEEPINGSSLFPGGYPFQFDFSEEKNSTLGFMELLGVRDCTSPLLDSPHLKESEVLNHQPPTPNSSSISSASSDELHNHNKTVDKQPPKQLKAKKTNQKRQREARFAFMTKSEVDHLEDGYRWRKYGQKAVKNSPFPRSYYRCTSASCNVKKRVERSLTDPSFVVTTYEGQHTHPSPLMGRASGSPIATNFNLGSANYISQYYNQHHQQVLANTLSSLGFPPPYTQERPLEATAALLRDHGLLQDVVPSHIYVEGRLHDNSTTNASM